MPSDRHIHTLETDLLEIAFEEGGPADGPVVLLLHGWPDDPLAWDGVAPRLNAAGFRTLAPWLRGFGPTRFRAADTMRDGSTEALAQDALDLVDLLEIRRFAVVGHDWGARIAYAMAALVPRRLTGLIALSVPYSPRGSFLVPPFRQSRAWWYQWLMAVDRGAQAVSDDPKGFARFLWDTWSPPGWFDEAAFAAPARSFDNPDWFAITLNSHRGRWREVPRDPRYDGLRRRVADTETLTVPTLMIQGGADGTVLPQSSEGKEGFFHGGYRRRVLDGVGHFPMREAPEAVAAAIIGHLRQDSRGGAAEAAPDPAQTEDEVAEKLMGAWDLVSWFETRPDGTIDYPLGEDAAGQILYTADGHVSAQLVRRNLARFAEEDLRKATEAERAEAWNGYFGYFGTYSIDVQQQAVIHHVKGSWFPNLVGTDQVRRYRFEGARLILDAETAWGRVEIIWERATPARPAGATLMCHPA